MQSLTVGNVEDVRSLSDADGGMRHVMERGEADIEEESVLGNPFAQ